MAEVMLTLVTEPEEARAAFDAAMVRRRLSGQEEEFARQHQERGPVMLDDPVLGRQRVTVNHDLEPGEGELCHACQRPLTDTDRQSAQYIFGVCCPHCHDTLDPERKARFTEQQRQKRAVPS